MRHPTEIPIEIEEAKKNRCYRKKTRNASQGGLAFICTNRWELGTPILIRMPLVKPVFESNGRIAWCRKRSKFYEVGVQFSDPEEAFKARMAEQLCQIEIYRKKLAGQGRMLDPDTAACEWIGMYAEDFCHRWESQNNPSHRQSARF